MVHPASAAQAARYYPGCGQPGRIPRLGSGGVYLRAVYLGFGRKCDAHHIIEQGVRALLSFGTIGSMTNQTPEDWKSLRELTRHNNRWFNKYLWKRS